MNKQIHELRTALFDFGLETYPIFDETYRDGLNTKILDHYNRYEIGDEDPAIFKEFLNVTMAEIMPYYNKLYESAALAIDPLVTFSRTETNVADTVENRIATNSGLLTVAQETIGAETETVDNTDTTNATNATLGTDTTTGTTGRTAGVEQTATNERAENQSERNYDKTVNSDTPAGLLSMSDIEASVYASTAQIGDRNRTATIGADTEENLDRTETESTTVAGSVETDTTTTTTGTVVTDRLVDRDSTVNLTGTTNSSGTNEQDVTGNTTTTTTASGYDRPLSELVEAHRKTFLNVDMMVIRAVADCFMLSYDWEV